MLEMETFDCLIVGAGHGGSRTAISLRRQGFTGSIGLIDAEGELPYERPPLTKAYLAGETEANRLKFSTEDGWNRRAITLIRSQTIIRIDPHSRVVVSASGNRYAYGKLVWAAGGAARQLACPGSELKGIHVIRTRADVDHLKRELTTTSAVAIIGGGYIGLEAAAVLTKLGKRVTVIEVQRRLLARATSNEISLFMAEQHRLHGVDIELHKSVSRLEGEAGRVRSVVLSDETRIAADLVIVGIGILPFVQPLLEAGAEGEVDVFVDETCKTTLDHIYAVGDCARHVNIHGNGQRVRLESVQNATDQGDVAASGIAGKAARYNAIPWFWSAQYDVRVQSIGLLHGYDEAVLRGDPASKKFSMVYLRDRRVIALDCVNNAKDFADARTLIGCPAARGQVADQTISLRSLAEVSRGRPTAINT